VSTALITGGSAGIGRSIAEKLLEKGYDVISLDIQPSNLRKVKHIQVDLTDMEATARAVKGIKATTLIHNAGVIRPSLLPDVKLEDFDALVKLHLEAPVVLMQALLPAMEAAKFGRVVLVSSRAVLGRFGRMRSRYWPPPSSRAPLSFRFAAGLACTRTSTAPE